MLLGAQLVAEGHCSVQDVEDALRAQAQFRGRLGSNLVEIGAIDLDVLAAALGRQRRVPPALIHHFRMVDAAALARIPKRLAEKYNCVPIGVPPNNPRQLAVAMIDPFEPGAVEELAFAAGARIVPMIAPELRMQDALAKFYGVARADSGQFVRVRSGRRPKPRAPIPTPGAMPAYVPGGGAQRLSMPAMPSINLQPDLRLDAPRMPAGIEELPLENIVGPASEHAPAPPRALTPPPTPPANASVLHVSIPKNVSDPPAGELMSMPPPSTVSAISSIPAASPSKRGAVPHPDDLAQEEGSFLDVEGQPALAADEAIDELSRAKTKDDVGAALTGFLRTWFHTGLLMLVRDDAALGWKGYSSAAAGDIDQETIEAIAMPLHLPSILRDAHQEKSLVHAPPPGHASAMETRLFKLLKCAPPADIVVAPIVLRGRVLNLVCAFSSDGAMIPDKAIGEVEEVVRAATDAYLALIKKAK